MYKKMPLTQTTNSSKDYHRSETSENIETFSNNPPHISPKSVTIVGPNQYENTSGGSGNGSGNNNVISDNNDSGNNGVKSTGIVKLYYSKWNHSLVLENK